MISRIRLIDAAKASSIHLLGSVFVSALAAALVFVFWYPFPYRDLAGGRELFLLVIAVDVVCGPLLTAVLFNRAKRRTELWRDLGLVALIQLGALGYGLYSVWLARPLFLVMEIDRFKVVAAPDLQSEAAAIELAALPRSLRSGLLSGPVTVAIRDPKDSSERKSVLLESIQGGRDYALRPAFYVPYEGSAALKSLQRAQPLTVFLKKQPSQRAAAEAFAAENHVNLNELLYVPVVGRQDWVAILNKQGQIEGFLPGDGF